MAIKLKNKDTRTIEAKGELNGFTEDGVLLFDTKQEEENEFKLLQAIKDHFEVGEVVSITIKRDKTTDEEVGE